MKLLLGDYMRLKPCCSGKYSEPAPFSLGLSGQGLNRIGDLSLGCDYGVAQ